MATISAKSWDRYIDALRKLNSKATNRMLEKINEVGTDDREALEELIRYAYGIATRYGEGASALSAEMYDALAELSGKIVPPAVPAPTASYGDVAKAVYGTNLQSKNPQVMADSIGRLVKMAGVDTMQQNALRDGAEWAWIPRGDTCAFCITLASNGWQPASKKAIKNGHAMHIHANCDCTYAIRFSPDVEVEGYNNGKEYRDMYYGAEGSTPEERINYMRRQFYAENKGIVGAESSKAEEFIPGYNRKTVSSQIKEFDPMNEYDYYDEKQEAYRLDEIIKQTGYEKEKAEEILNAFSGTRDAYIQNSNAGNLSYSSGWFYGQDNAIRNATEGEMYRKAQLIDDYIKAAPKYDGPIYRGMSLPDEVIEQFKVGGTFREKGNLSSWSSSDDVAKMFAEGRQGELGGTRVILETVNNEYSAPVSHLSIFGNEESEVLVSNMHKRDYIIESVSNRNGTVYIRLRLE